MTFSGFSTIGGTIGGVGTSGVVVGLGEGVGVGV